MEKYTKMFMDRKNQYSQNEYTKAIYRFNAIPIKLLLLLLLSCFNRVRLCVTPQTAAHQAPPSLGFSKQEYWSGLPFPSPKCMKVKSESEVTPSRLTLRDPMDCSLPGSSIHGIFQARLLEWGAIAFSPYQATNGILHRARTNNFTICMEIQKTSNSQSNLEKEEWNWRNQPA